MRGRLSARSLVLLAACAAACTATEEGNLGVDEPELHEDADAGEHEPVEPPPEVEAPLPQDDARDAQVTAPIEVRDAGVRDARAPVVAAAVDAGPEVCMQYGPKPGDRWDGGLPSLLGSDRLPPPGGGLLSPFEFEAGVPPFCCTLMTPWFCPPPTLP